MARKLVDKRAQFKSRVGVPGRYTARADRAATLFPLHLAPPPVLAPCTEAPLPEPEPPSAAEPQPSDVRRVREPRIRLTLEWAALQLVPSPALGWGDDGAIFGASWQVTPLLYSFATDARLNRFRSLMVEPIVRHSGSVEAFVSPEYLALPGAFSDRFGVRVGLRGYYGVIERGDYLSLSLASSYFRFPDHEGVTFEAGAYVLFGNLGFTLAFSPGFDAAPVLFSTRLRFF